MEDTLSQYETLLSLPLEKRENFFRYTMMKPFEGMWNTINVPLKAKQKNGYDVMMATQMLGYLDIKESDTVRKALNDLKAVEASDIAKKALKRCIEFSKAANLEVAAEELKFGMYIADPEKLMQIKHKRLKVKKNPQNWAGGPSNRFSPFRQGKKSRKF